jgi:hypothetical protein
MYTVQALNVPNGKLEIPLTTHRVSDHRVM